MQDKIVFDIQRVGYKYKFNWIEYQDLFTLWRSLFGYGSKLISFGSAIILLVIVTQLI